jgi:hypothetical protein
MDALWIGVFLSFIFLLDFRCECFVTDLPSKFADIVERNSKVWTRIVC